MIDFYERLGELAKRHAEISQEIKSCQSLRNTSLLHCHPSPDEDFEEDKDASENCLSAAYRWVEVDQEDADGCPIEFSNFEEAISIYGCASCKKAYEMKVKMGKLKQERGRIHSAITKIGHKL